MTFEDLWEEVRKTGILPNMAIQQIPELLSERTKKQMTKNNLMRL